MDYHEALEYIHGTQKFGWKFGLENIRNLLELMDNPHKKLKFVHVGGTNGKGSTVSFISSMLIEAGYKVGIYTSPYLVRFTERIKINDEEIDEDELAAITGVVREKVGIMLDRGDNHPTEFEIVTAIAFQYFHEKGCDIVVLEVGLGGRLDSTNVIDTPLVSVITTISYDHMNILGNTLEEIAGEKAGIIKADGRVVLYPQLPETEKVFENACREKNAVLYEVDFSRLKLKSFGVDGQVFDYENYTNLKISLLGEHQIKNAAVAIKTIGVLEDGGYKIGASAVRKGLLNAKWPGRLEIINRDPVVIIDGAHNAEGAKALSRSLELYFPGREKTFIIGVLKDKDFIPMIEAVAPIAERFVTVTPNSERAISAKELAIIIKSYCKNVQVSDTIEEAIEKSMSLSPPGGIICAFGSLYYIGGIREIFTSDKRAYLRHDDPKSL